MYPNRNAALKDVKLPSSDDFIAKGGWVQRYPNELSPEQQAKQQKSEAEQAKVAKVSQNVETANDYSELKRRGWI
ncbi:MAG: hypothetical protein HWN79_17600 [Candidatus Lokiarchaeota archaeon]|nr:hypothetical protein [Candidatus Lokiarchaeota archaeon]